MWRHLSTSIGVLGVPLAFLAITVAAVSLRQPCYDSDECPPHAVCRPHLCDMFICQCGVGYHHFNSNSDTCEAAVLVGQNCSSGTRCLPANSLCDVTSGLCVCRKGFNASRDGFKCKNVLYGRQPDLGDACASDSQCDYFSGCRNNTCDCKTNFTQWTEEEKWLLYPRPNFLSCKTPALAIDMCDGQRVSLPNIPHHRPRTQLPSTQPPSTDAAETSGTAVPAEPEMKPLPPPHAVPRFY